MINYVLADKNKDDIVYIGKDNKELRSVLFDYVYHQPHIDESKVTDDDLNLLRYSALKKIGLHIYAKKIN